MPSPEIEEFAELLMKYVRDNAISASDIDLHPTANGVVAHRWRAQMKSASHAEFAKMLIPDCVDEALFYLLYAIDEGLLPISFRASNGRLVDLTTEGGGELAGWFIGTEGWRAEFSKERFIDDFADMAQDFLGELESNDEQE